MSHKENDKFYESLTEALIEKKLTVRELFGHFQEGLLTRTELDFWLREIMDPTKNPVPPKYEIKGHRVSKAKYEEYLELNKDLQEKLNEPN